MTTAKNIIKPLRMDAEMDARIKKAAEALGLSESDVMRLSMNIGLPDVEAQGLKVAEKPAKYRKSKAT